MPGEQFLALGDASDAALAEWFGVPVEQVLLRRAEFGLAARGWPLIDAADGRLGAAMRLGQKVPRARAREYLSKCNRRHREESP
jgi:hypothetical protein